MEQEVLEKLKLLGCEIESTVIHRGDVAKSIQGNAAVMQDVHPLRATPTGQGPNSSKELIKGERLRQVVVGPSVQPAHDILGGIARREHQDRSTPSLTPELRSDLEAVLPGENDVEQNDVIFRNVRQHRGLVSVPRHVDDVSFLLQTLLDESGNFAIVFDDENPHT